MKGIRKHRLAQIVKEQVGRVILGKMKNPRLGFVTVVAADVSSDARTAKVYVSIIGDEEEQQRTLKELQAAKGFIQSQIAPHLGTRNTPVLNFKLDRGVKQSLLVSQLLKKVLGDSPAQTDAPSDQEQSEPPL